MSVVPSVSNVIFVALTASVFSVFTQTERIGWSVEPAVLVLSATCAVVTVFTVIGAGEYSLTKASKPLPR